MNRKFSVQFSQFLSWKIPETNFHCSKNFSIFYLNFFLSRLYFLLLVFFFMVFYYCTESTILRHFNYTNINHHIFHFTSKFSFLIFFSFQLLFIILHHVFLIHSLTLISQQIFSYNFFIIKCVFFRPFKDIQV